MLRLGQLPGNAKPNKKFIRFFLEKAGVQASMEKLGSTMFCVYLGRKIAKSKCSFFLLLPIFCWAWYCVVWGTLGVNWGHVCLLPACALHPQPYLLLGQCEKQKWLWCCADIIYFSAIAAAWVCYQQFLSQIQNMTPWELLWRNLMLLQAKPVHLHLTIHNWLFSV